MSTKSLSNEQTNHSLTAARAFEAILSRPNGTTRNQISKDAGLRLSTVCGAVFRLIEEGKVQVIGTVNDPETNRLVELLQFTTEEKAG